jgi:predicted DNA-binding transcriptional regulator AlpA
MNDESLWTPDDCARYLGIARWTFVNRVSKMPTFPKPHVELSRRMRRWLAEDVREWTHRTGRKAA